MRVPLEEDQIVGAIRNEAATLTGDSNLLNTGVHYSLAAILDHYETRGAIGTFIAGVEAGLRQCRRFHEEGEG